MQVVILAACSQLLLFHLYLLPAGPAHSPLVSQPSDSDETPVGRAPSNLEGRAAEQLSCASGMHTYLS